MVRYSTPGKVVVHVVGGKGVLVADGDDVSSGVEEREQAVTIIIHNRVSRTVIDFKWTPIEQRGRSVTTHPINRRQTYSSPLRFFFSNCEAECSPLALAGVGCGLGGCGLGGGGATVAVGAALVELGTAAFGTLDEMGGVAAVGV